MFIQLLALLNCYCWGQRAQSERPENCAGSCMLGPEPHAALLSPECGGFPEGKRGTPSAPLISETDCEAWARLGEKVLGQCLSPIPGRLPPGAGELPRTVRTIRTETGRVRAVLLFLNPSRALICQVCCNNPPTCGRRSWCNEGGCFQEPAAPFLGKWGSTR